MLKKNLMPKTGFEPKTRNLKSNALSTAPLGQLNLTWLKLDPTLERYSKHINEKLTKYFSRFIQT